MKNILIMLLIGITVICSDGSKIVAENATEVICPAPKKTYNPEWLCVDAFGVMRSCKDLDPWGNGNNNWSSFTYKGGSWTTVSWK